MKKTIMLLVACWPSFALAEDFEAEMAICRAHQNPPHQTKFDKDGKPVLTPLTRYSDEFKDCYGVESRMSAAASAAASTQKNSDLNQLKNLLGQ